MSNNVEAAMPINPGLGELLRYLNELVDQGAEERYKEMGLNYKARYTPVLRCLMGGPRTVSEITNATFLTQGAVSQTVALLVADRLVVKKSLEDGRKSAIHLTKQGRDLVDVLVPHWDTIFRAIRDLEAEIGHPLLDVLQKTAAALEAKGFSKRLQDSGARQTIKEHE